MPWLLALRGHEQPSSLLSLPVLVLLEGEWENLSCSGPRTDYVKCKHTLPDYKTTDSLLKHFSTQMVNLNLKQLETRWCVALQWRHNGRDSVSNHQLHDCLLNRLFRRRSKKTLKLRVTGLCVGNSPGTGEFLAQMASNAEMFPFDDVIMRCSALGIYIYIYYSSFYPKK